MERQTVTRTLGILASVLCAIFIARLVWPSIELPFSNPLHIVGPLTVARFNPANNVVRYLVFILAPTLGWLNARGWRLSWEPRVDEAPWPRYGTAVVVALISGLATMRAAAAFAYELPDQPLDFLHDGETLSAGYTALATGKLWTGTFFVHGLFYDPLLSLLAWRWTGHVSIGSHRYLDETLRHVIPLALAIFLVAAFFALRRHVGYWRAAAFALLAMAVVVWTEGNLHYLDMRDIYALLCSSVVLFAIATGRHWLGLTSGLMAGLGLFNTIERGAYVIVCGAGALFIAAVTSRERRRIVTCGLFIGGVVCSIAFVAAVVGAEEIAAFGKSLFYWVRNKDLMDAYVFPTPFTKKASLYTAPLLLNAMAVLVLVWALPGYWRTRQWSWLAAHAFFVMLACAYFRSALGRSDPPHVAYAATPAYIALAWTVAQLAQVRALRLLTLAGTVALTVFVFSAARSVARDAGAIATYAERGRDLSSKEDDAFLAADDREALAAFREALAHETCSFVYPARPAMHYLLRLPSCTRFYFTWFVTAQPHQEESIAVLEQKAPKHIVWSPSSEAGIDAFPIGELAPTLDAYIQSHYAQKATFGRWYLGERVSAPAEGSTAPEQ